MENNLENDEQEKKMEDIAEQDWPYLKELETTRFALKNKKEGNKKRQSLQSMKKRTEEEDQAIMEQNIEDEKLVDAFLSVKPSTSTNELKDLILTSDTIESIVEPEPIKVELEKETLIIQTIQKVEINEPEKKEIVPTPIEVDIKETISNKEEVADKIIVHAKSSNEKTISDSSESEAEKDVELSKLIARGMAKTYISKTDNILDPLRFILSNSKQLGVALIQFIIPAIITWYLTTNVELISSQLNKEAMHIHIVYTVIFYFACLFLWITGQVLVGGIWNLIKQSMNNLAKAGKN